MNVLTYNDLDTRKVSKQFKKVIGMIKDDDFRSADVKKLSNGKYYRARLDYENRLLFKIVTWKGEKYALLLEIIFGHKYERSRFLKGHKIDESKIEAVDSKKIDTEKLESLHFLNSKSRRFHILNKIISFDDEQSGLLKSNPPSIIIGSAGSGKTALTLEKIKDLHGDILYITHSPYLVDNSRNQYYAFNYENEDQQVDFLSFREFLETIEIPVEKEMNFSHFSSWFSKHSHHSKIRDCHKLYEEFNGVLTGYSVEKPFLLKDDYLNLGVRQSIFPKSDRALVYSFFEKYCQFLKKESFYDTNILSFQYLPKVRERYDFIVVDEVQDLTNKQLTLILKSLRSVEQFILCGDSNQIVHPNFFSWANIKTLFYEKNRKNRADSKISLVNILFNNYRNSQEVTDLANKLLVLKNQRFGSIDKETNYLVRSVSDNAGKVEFFNENEKILGDLNRKTKKSTKFAIVVMREEEKAEARRYFSSPLIFSIHEAKGLEYENIILFNFISNNEKEFLEISRGIKKSDLSKDLLYSRAKDKEDKSLEIFKFYINSLYVALTRAIQNIFLVERVRKHPLMDLLDIGKSQETLNLKVSDSSNEDWQQEARKLELQGKKEQAEQIKKEILRTAEVPWKVMDHQGLLKLFDDAFDKESFNRQAKLRVFEYALVYDIPYVFERLVQFKFKKAANPEKERRSFLHKYLIDYSGGKYKELFRKIELYGVDFRNPLNQTPLMIAAQQGNSGLVKKLIALGAARALLDNRGLMPLHIALRESYLSEEYAKNRIGAIYDLLAPDYIKIKIDNHLVKIDSVSMEFFLVNSMLANFYNLIRKKIKYSIPAFETADFVDSLKEFPEFVIPERRKKRAYISSIMSKNEIWGNPLYNKKLFVRVKRGYYLFNPLLEIDHQGKWVNIYDLLNLDALEQETHDDELQNFIKFVRLTKADLLEKTSR